MSIFNPIPPATLSERFTHKGWVGFCPVWVNPVTSEVSERNGCPEWVMWLNLWLQDAAAWCVAAMGGAPVDGWCIVLTGRLDGRPL